MGTGGTYREIVRPERLVRTERFDQDWTGGETLCTAVLTERDGVTTLDTTVRYSTMRAPDGALASGMEKALRTATTAWRSCCKNRPPAPGPGVISGTAMVLD
ncbi:SRPBCC domain-containing protein [Ralstonia syzygii]|uniref:SRPBCC domain-containing protein n=1 Tax=Ralstonia syzygii TaxID=28097 RepID=UPI001E2FEE52|nr:SRPBCC domain-containing protein [Ralstonia syzygii]